jgi:tetratricopeptide (TPR) repeat protein
MLGHGPFVASSAARPPTEPLVRPIQPEGPIDADTYELFRRGSQLLAARHAHQAVIALEQARDAAPRHGSVREALGRAYYGAGQTAAAGAEFAEAIEIDPTNDYAHFGLALCLARGGERTRALGHLRLAIAMRPGNLAYRRALSRVEHLATAPPTGRAADGPAGPGLRQAGGDLGPAGGDLGPEAPDPDHPPGGRA